MATFGYLKGRVITLLKESEDPDLVGGFINDASESLWEALLMANMESFMQGPVQNVTVNTGDERETLVTIADPVVSPSTNIVNQINNLVFPRTMYFKYTYVTGSGAETKASPATTLVISGANQLASVVAPQVPALNPVGSVGWNLYASDNPGGRFALQNQDPIDFSIAWQEDLANSIIDDPDLPAAPVTNTTADSIYRMSVIEVQNPDGTWTTWEGAGLDTLLFRRASRNLPVASSYQSYAYDILNGNQLEIRPQAGMVMNPRMFYIYKPPRIRFDQAQMPFANVAFEEYIINFSVSRVKLTNEEYDAHKIWESLADKKKVQLVESVNDQMVNRQRRITPFMY